MRGVNTYQTLKAVLEQAQASRHWPPQAILATGDLVQDETRAGYERFRRAFRDFGLPVYCLPGNHDEPVLMAEMLNHAPFQYCGTVEMGDWCLVLLSTFSKGDDGGRLSKQDPGGAGPKPRPASRSARVDLPASPTIANAQPVARWCDAA